MRPSTFLIGGVLLFMVIVSLFVFQQRPRLQERWAVYYHGDLPYADFAHYDIVAFDSDSHPDFTERDKGQVILGYLSTSEAEEYRDYYENIADMDVLLPPSERWAAKHAIDIRKPQWRDYFVHTLVPRVLEKGFDGIMLDTIDTPLYLEETSPQEFGGMRDAAIALVKEVRAAYPDIKIMLNRGFTILPEVAEDIDYALAESIRLRYDPETGNSIYFPDEIYNALSAQLKAAKRINPRLKVVTLDYTSMTKEDISMVKTVYNHHRRNHFIPYVTTYDLGNRHEEP